MSTKKKESSPDKILIIAEKPSVASDIVKALPGKFQNHKSYWEGGEGDSFVISFAIGHLLSICNPHEMDEKHKEWSLKNLPIIPEEFQLKPLPRTKSQLNTLGKLLRRRDIVTVVNGCDAGREGELIFRYLLKYFNKPRKKPLEIKRLWLQSMTPSAIREGFERLRSDPEMQNLAAAANSRAEADWLVGINGSRALTGYRSQMGGFFLTPCGRVQTPTLSMLVSREQERMDFRSKDFWELHGLFEVRGEGSYSGRWFDPEFKKDEQNAQAKSERIWDEKNAKAIADKCQGKKAEVKETQKPSTQGSPQLFDLTSLQREANSRFGFSAKNTLGIMQSLYERHKLVTYPRTDSRHLPADYLKTVQDSMKVLGKGKLSVYANKAISNNWVVPKKTIFDDAKVSDHHAIIPTTTSPGEGLSEPERKMYTLVSQRFIAAFFPPARFLNTSRISIVEGEHFKTEGKVLVEAGWKAVFGSEESKDSTVPPVPENAEILLGQVEVKSNQTKPPARFNESSLLSYMEGAGKYVEDEELKEALKERGLGTPATRAAIIEGLINDKYVVREGKELIPTAKAFELMKLLEAMGIEELTSPELTGDWEAKLNFMERGRLTRQEFMGEIVNFTGGMIQKIKQFNPDKEKKISGIISPTDNQPFIDHLDRYESQDGKLMIRKVLGGRQMNEEDIVELVQKRKIGPLEGFRSKKGRPFTAAIVLNDDNKVEFVFDETAGQEELDPSQLNEIGVWEATGQKVYETLTNYVSEDALKPSEKSDKKNQLGLKINKIILGKEIDHNNMERMLRGEKTNLIQGFRSSKTRRLFDASLSLSKTGKIEFHFPPRGFKRRKKSPDAVENNN